jgi:PPOX class probable F420-dependent enzyme
MQLDDGSVAHRLATWPVARLATRGSAGPRQVPIVFARVQGDLWSPIDGKSKSGRELARVRDVRADPRVSVLLDEYGPDWSRLWWIRIDGVADVVRPADPKSDSRVADALAALRAKYPQYESVPILREPPTLLRVRPRTVTSWCAGPGAAVRP